MPGSRLVSWSRRWLGSGSNRLRPGFNRMLYLLSYRAVVLRAGRGRGRGLRVVAGVGIEPTTSGFQPDALPFELPGHGALRQTCTGLTRVRAGGVAVYAWRASIEPLAGIAPASPAYKAGASLSMLERPGSRGTN